MALFIITPILTSPKNRSDGKGAFLVSAANAAAALARAEAMAGEVSGSFTADTWRTVALADNPNEDCVFESRPIGLKSGNTWQRLGRGGDTLAI